MKKFTVFLWRFAFVSYVFLSTHGYYITRIWVLSNSEVAMFCLFCLDESGENSLQLGPQLGSKLEEGSLGNLSPPTLEKSAKSGHFSVRSRHYRSRICFHPSDTFL